MKKILLIFMALTLFSFSVYGAVYNITTSADTYVNEIAPNTNWGLDEGIKVRANGADTFWGIFKFDLSGWPSGNLTNISLRLHNESVGGSEGLQINSTRNCVWNEYTITFNNMCKMDINTQYQSSSAGGFVNWNSCPTCSDSAFFNHTILSMGNVMTLRIDTNSANFDNYTSREGAFIRGESTWYPTLILEYNGTLPEPPPAPSGTGSALINFVTYTNPTPLDEYASVVISVKNNDSETHSYRIGFSIGNSTLGYCDTNCYGDSTVGASDVEIDYLTNTTWFGIPTIAPGESKLVTSPFKMRHEFFKEGKQYDVLVTVRPLLNYQILDNRTYTKGMNVTAPIFSNANALLVYTFNEWGFPTPAGVSLDNMTYLTTFTTTNSQGIEVYVVKYSESTATLGSHTVTAVDYASAGRRATTNFIITTYPTYIRLNLTPYNTCVKAVARSTQAGCEDQLAVANIIPGATTFYCKYNPSECSLYNLSGGGCLVKVGERTPPISWVMYACYNNFLPTGISNLSSYDISGNDVTGQDVNYGETTGGSAGQLAEGLGSAFGFNTATSLAFMSALITMIACVFIQVKLNNTRATEIVAGCLILMFTFAGWFPIWLFIILTIIAGYIVAKTMRSSASGG